MTNATIANIRAFVRAAQRNEVETVQQMIANGCDGVILLFFTFHQILHLFTEKWM